MSRIFYFPLRHRKIQRRGNRMRGKMQLSEHGAQTNKSKERKGERARASFCRWYKNEENKFTEPTAGLGGFALPSRKEGKQEQHKH